MKRLLGLMLLFACILMLHDAMAGVLYARRPGTEAPIYNLLISRIRTSVTIEGLLAVTHVDEEFTNPNNQVLEGFYAFQLPEGAVVDGLWLWVDGKRLTFIVKKKEDAERMYDSVVVGTRRDPAILESLGANRFQIKIFPIAGFGTRRIEMQYFHTLPMTPDGYVHYTYPLNMQGYQTQPVAQTQLSITVRSRLRILDFSSSFDSNPLLNRVTQVSDSRYDITFGLENQNYSQDYTLRYKPENLFTVFPTLTWHDPDTSGTDPYFMTWHPVVGEGQPTAPRDLVFVLDASGSMAGERILAVRAAVKDIIGRLTETDNFKIVLFSTDVLQYPDGNAMLTATSENIAGAQNFIDRYYEATALTNYELAFATALGSAFRPAADKRMLFLTDGDPTIGKGTTAELLSLIREKDPYGVRIYPVIFYSPSIQMLYDIAAARGGKATNVESGDNLVSVISRLMLDLEVSGIHDPAVQYTLGNTYQVFPESFPSVLAADRLITTGRFIGPMENASVTYTPVGGQPTVVTRPVDFTAGETTLKEVGAYWASKKIDWLMDQVKKYGEQKELINSIINLSIKHQVLTKYTAFLVLETNPEDPTGVDATRVVPGDYAIGAAHPNPFSPTTGITIIPFDLGRPATVRITVVDMLGRVVRVLLDGMREAGRHTAQWDGRDDGGALLAPGMYFVRLSVGTFSTTTRIALVR